MDYYSIAAAAVGGALGGAIGAVLGKKFKNKTAQPVATVVPLVLLAQIVPLIANNPAIKNRIAPPSAFEKLILKGSEEFKDDPTFTNALKGMSGPEASAFTQQKARAGLKRLPYESLKNWNDLRLKLAEVSPALCAGFWTGKGLTGANLQEGLVKLQEDEAVTWVRNSMRAAALEIQEAPFEAPPASAIQTGIESIAKGLSEPDRQRMDGVLGAGVNAPDEEACWTLKVLLKGAAALADNQKEQFLRALAAL